MPEPFVEGIAIIGAVGRFPGARNLTQFWSNLCAGRESVSAFTDAQLAESGFDPVQLRADSRYVPVRGTVDEAEWFDAPFFGFTPRQALFTDPQQRLFLEAAWEALEVAGCDPSRTKRSIGVFAGCGNNSWARRYLNRDLDELESNDWLESAIGNEKDYVATRVAYKLNLRGPAVSINTACSTSLVAICQACQALWTYQCDVAIAGGVNISFPQHRGYYHDDEGISSPDGHTRAFDAEARGTVFSNGLGIVVLKRLSEAMEDGDEIVAVIRGAALNNDGSGKASFTAPSADGQAEVIALAQQMAGVAPESVSYVETHGTATPIGDVIELAGLTKAFRLGTSKKQFCAIGSVKSNIGHLEHAAGVAGLIKTALALKQRVLPPSLFYSRPNPNIDFADSPFVVNATLRDWEGPTPRRAGVSSFGVGGTNAHVVLEEAPSRPASGPSRPVHVLPLSAKSEAALQQASLELADFLRSHPDVPLADVAFTLQRGRAALDVRRAIVARSASEAAQSLAGDAPARSLPVERALDRQLIFMFPGGGAQYAGAARGLCEALPEFERWIMECLGTLDATVSTTVDRLIRVAAADMTDADHQLAEQPSIGLPMLFAVEYAVAQYFLARGSTPTALIGHSLGEYAAACVSGVMSLDDAMALVQLRGRLFDELPAGAMVNVAADVERVKPYLDAGLDIAVINGPTSCVVSGPAHKIDELAHRLDGDGLEATRLHIAVAAHSALVEPILPAFRSLLSRLRFNPPRIPLVSNVTGTWLTDSQATDPDYWVQHLRRTVRFSEGLQCLFKQANPLGLEVGPGRVLSTITRAHPDRPSSMIVTESMRHPQDSRDDYEVLLSAQARLWSSGSGINWDQEYDGESRRRVWLPTYPFERQYFGPPSQSASVPRVEMPHVKPESVLPAARSVALLPSPPRQAPRSDRIAGKLCDILQELSGVDRAALLSQATFVNLGFDSLSLTQVSQQIAREFGVRVKFRQLLDALPTVGALAAHLDAALPADALPAPPALAVVSPAAPDVRAEGALGAATLETPAFVQEVIRQQLAVMTQQLAVLNAVPTASSDAGAAAASAPRPTVPVVDAPPSLAVTPSKPARFGPYVPPDTRSHQLSPRQQKRLDELIARYTRRTAGSKALTQKYRQTFADARAVTGFRTHWKEMIYQIAMARSAGSRMWDVDGNEYLDFTMNFGVCLFGHSPSFVVDAVAAQLQRGLDIGTLSPLAGPASRIISELAGVERVAFANTGTDAIMGAIRAARTATGRDRIVTFAGGYHGMNDEVLVRRQIVQGTARYLPAVPGVPRSAVENITVLDYHDPDLLEVLRGLLPTVAGVLVEPVQSRRPGLNAKKVLTELRRLTSEAGAALIFDELITGFRLHPAGAQGWFGIDADLVTYGKVISGGVPIAAIAGRSQFMDAFDGGMWRFGDASQPEANVTFYGGTYTRHPLGLASASAILRELQERGPALQSGLNEQTTALAGRLNAVLRARRVPIQVEHCGSIFLFKFDEGDSGRAPDNLEASSGSLNRLLYVYLRDKGVHLWDRPGFISTAHTEEDFDRFVAALAESVDEMLEAGFLEPIEHAAPRPVEATPVAVTTGTATTAVPQAAAQFPLSHGQKEIWLAAQASEGGSLAFNQCVAVRLQGPLDPAAFARAFDWFVERHEAFRVATDSSGETQRAEPRLSADMTFIDLSNQAAADAASRIDQMVSEESVTPFDLVSAPLFRCRLVRLSATEHVFLFTAHHIICDGWSMTVMMEELGPLYRQARGEGDADLLVPMAFSEWVHQLLASDQREDEAYWLRQFATPVDPLELPTDRPRPPVKTYGAGAAIANLDAVQFEPVKKAAARSGTTVFVSALTAYGLLLQRLTGQSDIVIGCAAAGQSSVEDRSLVGHCVSLLPIRLQFDPERAIGETIAHVRRQVLDAFDHDRYTYGQLLGKLPLKRDPSRLPLLSTVITYEVESPEIAFDDLTVGFEPRPRKYCNFDIELHIRQSRDGLLVWLYFNEALFDQSTIERWAEYYLQLLQHLGHEPNQPSGTLPMRPDAEFVTAAGLSGAGQSPRPGGNAYDSIAAPMARARHELAVSDSDGKLTYSALDQKAGRLVALAEFFRRGAASFRRTDALLRGDGAPMLRCLAARVRLLWARALKQAGAVHDEDSGNRMHSRSLHGTLRRRHALLLPYG